MSKDKDRNMVWRVLAPPAGPAFVPWPLATPEHLPPHDVRADILEEVADHVRVGGPGTALLPVLLPPAGRFEDPLVQAHPTFTDRVLQALVRTGGETVERDRNLAGDGTHALRTSSTRKNHRSEKPVDHRSHAIMLRRPGAPDAGTPLHQFLVSSGARRNRQHVRHRQRPDIRRRVESGPLLRGPGHLHVQPLDLPPGEP